jgi:cell division septum initiation protein DivIVA
MAKSQAEHAQALRDLTAQNEKARVEVLAKIAALEEAIANAGNTTEEVDAALADLKASVQTDDDIVPDAPPTEPSL